MTRDQVRSEINDHALPMTESIIADWRHIAEKEVWHSLPQHMTFDDLPNVIRAIAFASLDPVFRLDALNDILRYSSEHGLHRNHEGYQEGFLFTEYHLLRRSLWKFTQSRLTGTDAMVVITRIDAAISLATMAGLRGFHQQTFIQRGEWPSALFRLLDEWPLAGQ